MSWLSRLRKGFGVPKYGTCRGGRGADGERNTPRAIAGTVLRHPPALRGVSFDGVLRRECALIRLAWREGGVAPPPSTSTHFLLPTVTTSAKLVALIC